MVVLYPITYPLARALDRMFGEHNLVRFQKDELKALIEMHGRKGRGEKSGFTQEEIQMLTSTIDLREKSVVSVMTPLK